MTWPFSITVKYILLSKKQYYKTIFQYKKIDTFAASKARESGENPEQFPLL